MKAFINILYVLSRAILVGVEFAHASSLFALFHIAPIESWGFFVCSVIIKGFAFLDQSGLLPIQNRRFHNVVHVGNVLILCALWLLISLFDFDDQHWRSLANGWPVLIIVGSVMVIAEITFQTTFAFVREHRAKLQSPKPIGPENSDALIGSNVQKNAQGNKVLVVGLFLGFVCYLFYLNRRRV